MTIVFPPYCRDAESCVSSGFQKGLFLLVFSIIAVSFTSWAQTEGTRFFSYCPSSTIVKDHQGNTYRTVQIGSQCWMAENMRCTASPTGKRWIVNPTFSATQPEFAAYYAIPNDSRFGMLYNWTAALDLAGHHNSPKALPKPVRGRLAFARQQRMGETFPNIRRPSCRRGDDESVHTAVGSL